VALLAPGAHSYLAARRISPSSRSPPARGRGRRLWVPRSNRDLPDDWRELIAAATSLWAGRDRITWAHVAIYPPLTPPERLGQRRVLESLTPGEGGAVPTT